MNTATKLGAFALGLAAVFGGALGTGSIVGPVGATAEETGGHQAGEHGGQASGEGTKTGSAAPIPGGLQVS
jgi:hypothetical protein